MRLNGRLNGKDALATLLVAAVVVPYIGFELHGRVPFVHDVRGMAVTALILGVGAFLVGARISETHPARVAKMVLLGPLLLAVAVATIVTGHGALLAAFVVLIVVAWAHTTVSHAAMSHVAESASNVP